jgi:hypothetical protein
MSAVLILLPLQSHVDVEAWYFLWLPFWTFWGSKMKLVRLAMTLQKINLNLDTSLSQFFHQTLYLPQLKPSTLTLFN